MTPHPHTTAPRSDGGRDGTTRADRGRVDATTTCQNCGAAVTPRLVRVFGANDGTLHACPECETYSALANGAGAEPGGDE